ncbi:YHS domain-containing (seleno)protein [Spongiimicrobium salis]|uniref:YHS domain-containing (seleno)protein n=1 Tax=Spongiimicrobium salis TaxID=1667022 RepID=UPI00374D2E1C
MIRALTINLRPWRLMILSIGIMKRYLLVFGILLGSLSIRGQQVNHKKVAVHGYDLVAYFQGRAIQGTSVLSAKVEDVYYHFSSAENRALFQKNPQQYLPKFGGFCAIGIAMYDGKYDIDPEDFLIDGGALYLFCPDQLENWKADRENLKKKAEVEWARMQQESDKK